MTEFEPRTYGVRSDRSPNWATTNDLVRVFLPRKFSLTLVLYLIEFTATAALVWSFLASNDPSLLKFLI